MIRIGVLCPSDIAFRRFLPSLNKLKEKFKFIGVAVASHDEWFKTTALSEDGSLEELLKNDQVKANEIIQSYGGRIFYSYFSLVSSNDIDAVYIPLPPALHYKWAKLALENGKHVLIEKPSTTSQFHTQELVRIASDHNLVIHENYMFLFHNQINEIESLLNNGVIGEIRLFRLSFGFPRRSTNDFRYNEDLGGGALIDAGGYTVKLAKYLLGESAKLVTSQMNYLDNFEVDIFGSATMINDNGIVAQLAFGMDNDYKCDIEVWGSKGSIASGRIFTAPEGFTPTVSIKRNQEFELITLPTDDSFKNSINFFYECIFNDTLRKENYRKIKLQAQFIEQFKILSNKKY